MDDAVTHGTDGGLGAALDLEFDKERFEMRLDWVLADETGLRMSHVPECEPFDWEAAGF